MKNILRPKGGRRPRGMTLIELTVVILVLLGLISLLVIGTQAWKNGSDRSACIMNIRNAQLGVRSYQNLNGLAEGATINVLTDVVGTGGFFNTPICPGGGTYSYGTAIPALGTLVIKCSLEGTHQHVPTSYSGW